jgi:acetyltransferase-like isoleucine patch superfamily enzyme
MNKLLVNILSGFIPFGGPRRKFRQTAIGKMERHRNNEIIVIGEDGVARQVWYIKNVNIKFNGCNNRIEIHAPFRIHSASITLRDNSVVKIGRNSSLMNFNVGDEGWIRDFSIIIGDDFQCGGMCIQAAPNGSITSGNGCLFSWGISIRGTDSHLIYKVGAERPSRHGNNRPVVIGNHVWVGTDVTILKGAKIPDNCVVGTRALVTGKNFCEENAVIAGNPARVVKTGITWEI